MKKLTIFFLCLSTFSIAIGQERDILSLLNENDSISCQEMSYKSQEMIAEIDPDSIRLIKKVLEEWEEKCGRVEPIYRLELLLRIKEKKPIDIFYTDEFQDYFDDYKCRFKASEKDYDPSCDQYRKQEKNIPIHEGFDDLTKQISYELLLARENLDMAEKAICYHYNNQFIESHQCIYHIRASKGDERRYSCRNQWKSDVFIISPKVNFQHYFGTIQKHMEQSIFLGGNIGLDIHNYKIYGKMGALINLKKDSFAIEYDAEKKDISNRVGAFLGGGASIPVYKKSTNFFIYSNAGIAVMSYRFSRPNHGVNEENYDYIEGYTLNTGLLFNWKINRKGNCSNNIGITLDYQYMDFYQSRDLLKEKINGHGLSIGLVWGFKNRDSFFL